MNEDYLKRALELVKDKKILITVAGKRANEISKGSKLYVRPQTNDKPLDIALLEIAEGKIKWELKPKT